MKSIVCIFAATAASAATMTHSPSNGVMRREDRARHNALLPDGDGRAGVVSARGHFFPNSMLESRTFNFRLKSIDQGKCLELDGETFTRETCNMTEPKQEFSAAGITGPEAGAVASSITTYNNKLLCVKMVGGLEEIQASDTCDTDSKKFRFEPSGVQCFRVKLFLTDRCMTFTMSATSTACEQDESQWTAETSQSTCPTLQSSGGVDDGLQGGGAEGGEGGEAEQPQGGQSGAIAAGEMATSTVAPAQNSTNLVNTNIAEATAEPSTAPPGVEEGGTVAPGTIEGEDLVVNQTLAITTTAAPTPAPTTTTVFGFRFMLKSIDIGECLRLNGQTFQIATCDSTDNQQYFTAHGFLNPGDDVIANNISTYNGKVLCFDGSDKVEAYDQTCVSDFTEVELEPVNAGSSCFYVKWNANTQIANDLCLAPPSNDQDMLAMPSLCNASSTRGKWTADMSVRECT